MSVRLDLAPYYDDYDEDKQFHRILFRPSRSVQARELTQLQTILQNQITRMGQNLFADGTVIVPGAASIDTKYEYVKLTDTDIDDLAAGATLVGQTSGLVATLIQKVAVENSDPATLYVRYVSAGGGDGGRFQNGETISYTNEDLTAGSVTVAASAATGQGTKVDLDKGIYFVKGVFAAATTQSLIIEKYGIPTGVQEIGLVTTESIVTSDDDTSLLSNADGTNNKNAPGADRLKIALTLVKKEDIVDINGVTSDDYFTIITLKDQVIVESLTRTVYAALGDTMARRTYDESGDYTIDPFIVKANEHDSDETKLTLTIDPGKAYVKGYEITKPISTDININRALTTDTKANGKIATVFGSYVRTSAPTGLADLSTYELINLKDSGGTTRGTARVRACVKESATIYRWYLIDVSMNASYGFNQVRTLSGATLTATVVGDDDVALSSNIAALKETDKNIALFKIPFDRVSAISDITVRAQRYTTATADGSGNLTLDTGDANVTWADTTSWIVVRTSTGAVATPTIGTAGSQTIAISGLVASQGYTFYAFVDKTTASNSARTKTLTTVTDSVITPGGGGTVSLGQFDIYELVAVKDVSNADADITSRYTLDNGQRNNYYDQGRLLLKTNQTAPAGNVKVTFKYFAHGPGDYFNVNSYNSFVGLVDYTYGDIPTYTSSDGTEYRLADVFDFRSKKNTSGTFSGSGAFINEMPKPAETIQADIDYYLPRIDVLYLDSAGAFGLVSGNSSLDPKIGHIPANCMPIYEIRLSAGTLNERDIALRFIENRRYTMRDIGKIEARIAKIEEWATLSLLEARTDSLEVLDDTGNPRFKSGFFVDNFANHAFANFGVAEYRASIDPRAGLVRPSFVELNTKLLYKATTSDSLTSSGVVRKGNTLMMDYTEAVEVAQTLASSAVNVNPYSVFTGTGSITLSPSSDEWKDVVTTTETPQVIETPAINPVIEANWAVWEWGWFGTPILVGAGNRFDGFGGLNGISVLV